MPVFQPGIMLPGSLVFLGHLEERVCDNVGGMAVMVGNQTP